MSKSTSRSVAALYARYFTPAELKALRVVSVNDPISEINMLRVQVGRYFGRSANSLPADINLQMSGLQAISKAASMIAALVRTQNRSLHPSTVLEQEIEEALDSVRKELGIFSEPDEEENE